MRRLSFLAGLALISGAGLNLLMAQHAGGHGGGGHTSSQGVQGHGQIHSGGPSSTINSTLSNRSSQPGQLIYPTPLGLQHQYSGYTGINPGVLSNNNNTNRHDNRGRNGNGQGFGYGYGGAYVFPYLYSTYDDSPTPYVYNTTAQDPASQDADMNANRLGEQVERLSAEVESLRNERNAASNAQPGPVYNAPPSASNTPPPAVYATPSSIPLSDASSATPVTLVLLSGKHLQIKNYAVMGKNIWDFSAQPAKRIALSSVDLNASRTATEASGGDFPEIH